MLRLLFQKKKKGKEGYFSTVISIGKWYKVPDFMVSKKIIMKIRFVKL